MKTLTLNIVLRIATILLFGMASMSCSSSRKTVSFDEVKEGQHLNRAVEISVNQFFQIWMNNRYPQKIDLNCHELYKDDKYVYFGEHTLKGLNIHQNIYKVQSDSLKEHFSNYLNIDGEMIRQEFWEEVIPQSDKDIRKNADCNSGSSSPIFRYELQKESIKITLDWKYKCDFKTLIDKTYLGYYDMEELEIKK